jgi:hypothetical protein
VTFEGAAWPVGPALGLVARVDFKTPLDIDERPSSICLVTSDSSSDIEGVGGKYSKLGESKSRAGEAIEMRFNNGTSEGGGQCSHKLGSFYTYERKKGGGI